MSTQIKTIVQNPVTYTRSPGDQSVVLNELRADEFLTQELPSLFIRFDLFLRWRNPIGGGGLQFSLTMDNSSLFLFEDGQGNQYSSGDIVQLTGGFVSRLDHYSGMINTTGGTLTLSRGLVTQVTVPTIIKRNSMYVFTH